MHDDSLLRLVDRWTKSGGAERANYQLFLAELCDCLGVERPVEDDAQNAYVFERGVRFDTRDGTHSTKQMDLDKRGSFVCKTKHGHQGCAIGTMHVCSEIWRTIDLQDDLVEYVDMKHKGVGGHDDSRV
jgi:hypothetical protein